MVKTTSQAVAADQGQRLILARNFQPDADLLISEGVSAFGIKGSGKSNLVALLAEQFARFLVPQLILDSEGEYASLLSAFPRGVRASAKQCPSGYDILHQGLQVVVDLRSWSTDEAAALAIAQIIGELFIVSGAQSPADRVPCIIHLDEAGYWLPQDAVSYLSKETRRDLADTFHLLATRGRKQGLTPFLYGQRISKIDKTAISQSGIQILMRQALDIDIARYGEYVDLDAERKDTIRSFPAGKAVVCLPDGSRPVVQFYPRATEHTAHTPRSRTALVKFAHQFDPGSVKLLDLTVS